jgi:hypothetical protein
MRNCASEWRGEMANCEIQFNIEIQCSDVKAAPSMGPGFSRLPFWM